MFIFSLNSENIMKFSIRKLVKTFLGFSQNVNFLFLFRIIDIQTQYISGSGIGTQSRPFGSLNGIYWFKATFVVVLAQRGRNQNIYSDRGNTRSSTSCFQTTIMYGGLMILCQIFGPSFLLALKWSFSISESFFIMFLFLCLFSTDRPGRRLLCFPF